MKVRPVLISWGVDEIPGEIESANCRVMSTRELYQQMTKGLIDVEPPYQRDVVWIKAAQSSLIDSIFKNKWVPTLLFSERRTSVPTKPSKDGRTSPSQTFKTKKTWVCMDGKQRLTSIKLFINGQIPWNRQPGKSWYFKQSNPPSPSRLILSEELKETFFSRGITTALYHGLDEMQERDIFRLVQEGKPLTIGEKMAAETGPWAQYINELTTNYMTRDDDKHPNGWAGRITNMTRGADFKTMSAMVMLLRDKEKHDPPSFFTSQHIQKEMNALRTTQVPPKLKSEIKILLDNFMQISLLAPPTTQFTIPLNTPEAIFEPIRRGRKSMISPVEMIWIPYMISKHGRQLSTGRLLELIELFKVDIRAKYPREVKNNKEVTRFIIEWIQNAANVRRVQGKYSGYKVPVLPEADTPDSSVTTPGSVHRSERTDPKVNSAGGESPPTNKRKASTAPRSNGTTAGPSVSHKRPRQSAPAPSQMNPPPSSTSDSQHAVNATATQASRVPVNGSTPSTMPTTNGQGARPTPVDGVGTLFGNHLHPRLERLNQTAHLPGLGVTGMRDTTGSQFNQPLHFRSRLSPNLPSFDSSQRIPPQTNLHGLPPRPKPPHWTNQPL
ncbi:hypothetical protein DFH28DRAFT_899922 [Melampsora americana]|nr:hypothetical protein DFH28DRAFT_899922 [Melampsora americana]